MANIDRFPVPGNLSVAFLPIGSVEDELYKYAVLCTMMDHKLLLVRTNGRSTWEMPGGRREPGEAIDETARRELIEETGAVVFDIEPVGDYSVTIDDQTSYGRLFRVQVFSRNEPIDHETDEVGLFESLPDSLTYPSIQPLLLQFVSKASGEN